MKRKVSIIVPVYNAEVYLHECLDSIINQTYKNLEIILVNDGSEDNSGEICREYKSRDSRIVYIEQDNKGEGGARNTGLRYCTGDYVEFCDSDDMLLKNSVELLIGYMDVADLAVGGIEKKNRGEIVKYIPVEGLVQGREEIAECILQQNYYMNPVCCKLFRADIIRKNSIYFNDYKYGADTDYIYKYLCYTDRIFFAGKPVYRVNVVEGSMSTGVVINSWKYMKELYELSKDITNGFDRIRHGMLLRTIKTTLLLECRVSEESFLKTCKYITEYILREESDFKIYSERIYNKFIYFLLINNMHTSLYKFICFRVKWGIRL